MNCWTPGWPITDEPCFHSSLLLSHRSIAFCYTHLFWNCSFSNYFLNYRVELSLFFSEWNYLLVNKDERVYEQNYYTYSFLKEVKPQETKHAFSFMNLSFYYLLPSPKQAPISFFSSPLADEKRETGLDWTWWNSFTYFLSSKESRLRILLFQPLCLRLVFFLHSAILLLLSFTLYLTNLSFLYSSSQKDINETYPLQLSLSFPYGFIHWSFSCPYFLLSYFSFLHSVSLIALFALLYSFSLGN